MIILGIDPGSVVTGYGVLESSSAGIRHIRSGSIAPANKMPFFDRLVVIYDQLVGIIEETQPTHVAIEEIFKAYNVDSLIKLGHARGVACLAARKAGIPLYEYSALAVKKSLVGYGMATKDQVAWMVKKILTLQDPLRNDTTDALAIAICHTHSIKIQERLTQVK
jgi:crossover junction endodeoxyribonuclease RuvC